jgi:hypothetical protein
MNPEKVKSFLIEWLPITLILILGLALRVSLLITRGSFVFDDLFSIHFSSLPLGTALRYWLIETNPPLHLAALRFFLFFVDQRNEFLTRSISTFFALSGIAATYLTAKKNI